MKENIQPQDAAMMAKALGLANLARVIAPPNPWVGCVIVNEDRIVGEGFTQAPGRAHAEIVALEQAKALSKGSTAYVTLEPCAHYGRTPPCVNALIEAGISRVVIGIQDPDVHVHGKGVALLRAARIAVTEGVLSEEISRSLAPYLWHRRTGLPYCLLKGATSIDGRAAAADGTSQWISSDEAREDCHRIRAESQAILVGSGTANADLPSLTVRGVDKQPSRPPLRVILDSHGSTQAEGPLFNMSLAPTLIFTSSLCPQKIRKDWENSGVEVETVSLAENGMGVDLGSVMNSLGKRGILQVMVEGGGKILGAFLEENIFNHLTIYVGNRVLGNGGTPLFGLDSITTLEGSPKLRLLDAAVLGNSVRLDYEPS